MDRNDHPAPDARTRIVLKSGKDQSLKRFHPWVFSGAIKKILGPAREGDLVDVYDNKDAYLATGHYQEGSIAVRVLSFERKDLKEGFWEEMIAVAWRFREKIGLAENNRTNLFRWVNAEGDGLPGLIIDYYNGAVVIQMHSLGMHRMLGVIERSIRKTAGKRIHTIYMKSGSTLPERPGIRERNGFLMGEMEAGEVMENGYTFLVNWVEGQKTGFFIDQRDNRNLLASWSSGRRMLNLFGYTGGFSVYGMGGGASFVQTVDSSRTAVEIANLNAGRNFPDDNRHSATTMDAFRYLEELEDRYDLIVLDPPAFAKHHRVLSNALQGYKRLNQKAFEKIAEGGILFTFSCSQAVSRENFRKSVFVAAANARRRVRLLHQLSQPPDHPVSLYHPEGEYLKGLVLAVE